MTHLKMNGQKTRRLALLVIMALPLVLCFCTPRGRYRIAAVFFDGVPEPSPSPETVVDSTLVSLNPLHPWTTGAPATDPSSLHPPYAGKECQNCHDRSRGFALNASPPDLCYGCHENYVDRFKTLHAPVAEGLCLDCHLPHRAENASLLVRKADTLCAECHDAEALSATGNHPAIEEQACLECHTPHGSDQDHLLL